MVEVEGGRGEQERPSIDIDKLWSSSKKSVEIEIGNLFRYGPVFWRWTFWSKAAAGSPIHIYTTETRAQERRGRDAEVSAL